MIGFANWSCFLVLSPPEPSDDAVESVLEAVAAATGADPGDLPPLHDAVDPDALTAALDSADDGVVTFTHCGRYVTVDGDGYVTVGDRID